MPGWLLVPALSGALAALAGGYWDDAWHTERGRDEFLIAPHIAIYAGIATAGGALALWALLAPRRALLAHPPLLLGAVSVLVTLASGPIDNAWHEAFGRDAVIWSPPHMLGIAGTAGLAAALMAEVAGRGRRVVALVAGALLLAALAFPVVEYETDVPQFDEALYLPVLTLGAALALALVRLATGGRWAATATAGLHLGLMAGIALFLEVEGFDRPLLPLLVVPGATLDVLARRGARPLPLAAGFTLALHATYVPALALLGEGVRLDPGQVVLSLPLAFLAAWGAFAAVARAAAGAPRQPVRRHQARRAMAGAAPLALLLLAAAPASAHDPGQGEEAGGADLRATVQDGRARVSVAPDGCARLSPRRIVARRAGEERSGALRREGCEYRGEVALDERGRWFVYAELDDGTRPLETWLPVKAGNEGERFERIGASVYEPPERAAGAGKIAAGIVMYVAILALLVALIRLVALARAPARAG